MFDRNAVKTVGILSGTRKTCSVRFPTDAEWAARSRGIKMVRQQIGRGKSKPVPQDREKVDAALFAAIRVDKDGAEFDAAEAGQVIDAIEACKVAEVEMLTNEAVLSLEVGKVETKHRLRFPFSSEQLRYERLSISRIDAGRWMEVRVAMEPAGDLYDALSLGFEGYAGEGLTAVPLNHKFAVVHELLEECARLQEDLNDPEA